MNKFHSLLKKDSTSCCPYRLFDSFRRMIPPFLLPSKSTDWFFCFLSWETAFLKHHTESNESVNKRLLFAGLAPGYRRFLFAFLLLYFVLWPLFFVVPFLSVLSLYLPFIPSINRCQTSLSFSFLLVFLPLPCLISLSCSLQCYT